jgi:iron complex outermembrane receptor protein
VSKDFEKVTPSFTAAYQLTPDANVYFRYAEGYRSGGFNGRSSTPDQVATAFEPGNPRLVTSSVSSRCCGISGCRSTWPRFLSDYKDLQQVLTAPTSTGVGFQTINDNVGKITITGLEVETRLAATDNLEFYLNYAYLDTDIDDYTLVYARRCAPDCQPTSIGNERVIPLISKDHALGGSGLPRVLD